MTVTAYDFEEAIQELVFFLRNSDVFSTTQRGVTTTSATGTFASASSFTITGSTVKNVRSVVVAATPLTYGLDYSVDTEFDNAGTKACKLTFTTAKTGAYTITYDYGTDKIYDDWPLEQLTISEFPRISIGELPFATVPGGFGNVNLMTPNFSVTVFDAKKRMVRRYLKAVRQAFINNRTGFYYFKHGVVFPTATGPMLPTPRAQGKDKVFQMNQDFEVRFVYEK